MFLNWLTVCDVADGPTEIMKFVTGCKLFMDPLHILDEGFLKDMLVGVLQIIGIAG